MARPDLENQRYVNPLYVDGGKVDGLFTVDLVLPGISLIRTPGMELIFWIAPFACEVVSAQHIMLVPETTTDCVIGITKVTTGSQPMLSNLILASDLNITTRTVNTIPGITSTTPVTTAAYSGDHALAAGDMLGYINNAVAPLVEAENFALTILLKRL